MSKSRSLSCHVTSAEGLMGSIGRDIDRKTRRQGQSTSLPVCETCKGPIHDDYRYIDVGCATITMLGNERFQCCESCGCIRLIKEPKE